MQKGTEDLKLHRLPSMGSYRITQEKRHENFRLYATYEPDETQVLHVVGNLLLLIYHSLKFLQTDRLVAKFSSQ